MKKVLIALGVIVVIIAAGLVYVYTQLDTIVAGIIEQQGSAATGTPVAVSGVSIDLRDARGEISDLSVGNPEGYGGTAVDLGGFVIRIDPGSLAEDTIVLNEVTVSGARVNMVQRASGNNLRELLDNLRAGAGATGDEPAAEGAARRLIVERFVLEDASASVSLPELGEERSVDIPRIELTGIGRATGGATGAEVARQVLEPVVERALRSAAAESVKERAQEKVDEAKEGLLKGLREKIGGEEESQ